MRRVSTCNATQLFRFSTQINSFPEQNSNLFVSHPPVRWPPSRPAPLPGPNRPHLIGACACCSRQEGDGQLFFWGHPSEAQQQWNQGCRGWAFCPILGPNFYPRGEGHSCWRWFMVKVFVPNTSSIMGGIWCQKVPFFVLIYLFFVMSFFCSDIFPSNSGSFFISLNANC